MCEGWLPAWAATGYEFPPCAVRRSFRRIRMDRNGPPAEMATAAAWEMPWNYPMVSQFIIGRDAGALLGVPTVRLLRSDFDNSFVYGKAYLRDRKTLTV